MALHEHQQEQRTGVGTPRVSTSAETSIQSLSDKAKSDVAQAAESAKCEARRIAGDQKEAGATTLGEVAGAVHGAARSLETEMPQMASYVHDAAARLEDAARTLRTRNVDELVNDIGHLARSQPALLFGGAMLAGFALTRFLKSTAPDNAPPEHPASSSFYTSPTASGRSSSPSSSSQDTAGHYDAGSSPR